MADITMCKGNHCTLKETCYRHKAVANSFRQSYFAEPPYTINKDSKIECEYYWKDKNDNKKEHK